MPKMAPVKWREPQYDLDAQEDLFTAEEVAERNAKEVAANEAGLKLVKEAGFIALPLYADDLDGEPYEGETWVHPDFEPSRSEGFFERHGMHYNIYVPSYERAQTAATLKMLEEFGATNWYVAVDPSQFEAYSKEYPLHRIIIRDINFRRERLLDLNSSIASPDSMHGHAGICNFLLAFSRSMRERRYWTMDDDIMCLALKAHKGDEPAPLDGVYNKDDYYRCSRIREEYGFNFQSFMEDMENVARATRNAGFIGLEKFGLVFRLPVMWKLGTRVYSFYLSDNKTQVTHLGQHNNDVITSLELSKHGLVNCLFEGIGYHSGATQTAGGQTEVYKKFGTLDKGKVLVRAQPNFSKISYEYSRIHHSVDYNTHNKARVVGSPVGEED